MQPWELSIVKAVASDDLSEAVVSIACRRRSAIRTLVRIPLRFGVTDGMFTKGSFVMMFWNGLVAVCYKLSCYGGGSYSYVYTCKKNTYLW